MMKTRYLPQDGSELNIWTQMGDWMEGLHVGFQGSGPQPSWSSQQGPGRRLVPHKSISNEILVQGDANRLANNHAGLKSKLLWASAGAFQVRAPIWT